MKFSVLFLAISAFVVIDANFLNFPVFRGDHLKRELTKSSEGRASLTKSESFDKRDILNKIITECGKPATVNLNDFLIFSDNRKKFIF